VLESGWQGRGSLLNLLWAGKPLGNDALADTVIKRKEEAAEGRRCQGLK
jgi:hypothetical protein